MMEIKMKKNDDNRKIINISSQKIYTECQDLDRHKLFDMVSIIWKAFGLPDQCLLKYFYLYKINRICQ